MVMIVEGIPYFAFPGGMKEMILVVLEQPEAVLRRFGLMLMMMGLVIVYLGRSFV
jgi:uncharacterized protein YjeT (DUF2065 family)